MTDSPGIALFLQTQEATPNPFRSYAPIFPAPNLASYSTVVKYQTSGSVRLERLYLGPETPLLISAFPRLPTVAFPPTVASA